MGVFTESFENANGQFPNNPPWHRVRNNTYGILECRDTYSILGNSSFHAQLPCQLYGSTTATKQQIEYNPDAGQISGGYPTRYPSWFAERGERFAFYVPSDFIADPWNDLIYQHHNWSQCPVYGSISPCFALYLNSGWVVPARRWEPTGAGASAVLYYSYGQQFQLVPGKWHYVINNFRYDYQVGGNGYYRVYMAVDNWPTINDIIVNYNGPTGLNATASHNYTTYTTFGIYAWNWQYQSRVDDFLNAGGTEKEYYFDAVTIDDTPITVSSGGPYYNTLQALINANAGGTVTLESGATYVESAQITIPVNTTLDLNNATITTESFFNPTFTMQANYMLIRVYGDNVTIKNGTIDGNNKQCYGAIFSRYYSNLILDNLDIKDMYYTGIWVPGGTISNTDALLNTGAVTGINFNNLTLTNCANGDVTYASQCIGLGIIKNSTIQNITINESIGYGIGMQNYGAYLTWNNVLFDNCDVTVPDQGTWAGGGAAAFTFSLDNGSQGYDIVNCRITTSDLNNMMSIVNKSSKVREISCLRIDNNRIIINSAWEPRTIVEMGENGITFEDNYITNAWEVFGFYTTWTIKNPIIRNNVIEFGHITYTGWFRAMIAHYGTVENALIENNTIVLDADYDFYFIQAGQNVLNPTVQKNILISNPAYTATDKQYTDITGTLSGPTINDNIIYGAFTSQGYSQIVSPTLPVIDSSEIKPFPYYQSLTTGYGAYQATGIPPVTPSSYRRLNGVGSFLLNSKHVVPS